MATWTAARGTHPVEDGRVGNQSNAQRLQGLQQSSKVVRSASCIPIRPPAGLQHRHRASDDDWKTGSAQGPPYGSCSHREKMQSTRQPRVTTHNCEVCSRWTVRGHGACSAHQTPGQH